MHLLITNNGPHEPERWAEVTASQIIDISAQAPDAKLSEAKEFRDKLVTILSRHHGNVQEHERAQISIHGHARLMHDLDTDPHIADPVNEVIAASKGYSFESHFNKPETRTYLENLLSSHFASAMHIERSWHANRNSSAPEVKAFFATHHPGE